MLRHHDDPSPRRALKTKKGWRDLRLPTLARLEDVAGLTPGSAYVIRVDTSAGGPYLH